MRTTAENRSCSNSTTVTSFHSKQQQLQRQFIIIQIMVQHLEEDVIFAFLMTQTSIPVHVRILVIVIRMLHTFMVMLIHRLDFLEVLNLGSRIMKSGESLLNDRIRFFILLYFELFKFVGGEAWTYVLAISCFYIDLSRNLLLFVIK